MCSAGDTVVIVRGITWLLLIQTTYLYRVFFLSKGSKRDVVQDMKEVGRFHPFFIGHEGP
jgi:hypothetical protein